MMEAQFRLCRVCRAHEGNGELVPIFEKSNKVAMGIFVISGVKISDNITSCNVSALICISCIKDLSRALKFRYKCRETEDFLKKSTVDVENLLTGSFTPQNCVDEVNENTSQEPKTVKEESLVEEQIIKDEPEDEFNLELYEHIDTILEENLEASEGSNALAVLLKRAKREGTCSDNSDDDSEYEEMRRRRKLKGARRSPELDEGEIMQPNGMAQCNLCYKTFTSLHSVKDHMRAIHQQLNECDMFKCPHCDRLFKMKYYLNRHIKSYHQKQIKKKEKSSKTKLKIDGDEIFKEKLVGLNCPYCNKFLTSKHSLNDHIRVRHEYINFSERFLCDICGKDFPLKYYLLRHIRASHLKTLSYKKKNEDHLPCSICGKILKSKGNLSTHEKTHRILSPDEYWYCDICGNKFKGRGEMTVHIKKRHLYKIRYPCEQCPGKSWRTLFQLQRHVKVFHNNIREFKCEWCGKEFGEKNKLVCHVRIHTGEQPFKCNFAGCTRAFTHQTDLRRHVWGHTGERPYKCQNQACLKGFMKKSELTAHESRCHPAARPNMPMPFQYQMM